MWERLFLTITDCDPEHQEFLAHVVGRTCDHYDEGKILFGDVLTLLQELGECFDEFSQNTAMEVLDEHQLSFLAGVVRGSSTERLALDDFLERL